MTNGDPLVSVYIPTKNRLPLLKRAVESVLNQTHENIELLIVDDASSDETWSYLKNLAARDARVHCFRNEVSKGAPFCRNIAINASIGQFITGLDDDDFFTSPRIESFLGFWKTCSSDVLAIYSDYSVISKSKNKKEYKRKKKATLRRHFLTNSIGNQVFSKSSTFKELGGFDEKLPVWQDYELWMRFLKKGKVIRAPFNTYVFDHSHDSERITNVKKEKVKYAFDHIARKHGLSHREMARFSLFACAYLGNLSVWRLLDLLRYGDILGLFYLIKGYSLSKIKRVFMRD